PVTRIAERRFMIFDAATRRNLELTETLSGTVKGSLLSTIDRTVTAAGAREFAARLCSPLTDATAINERLDSVACLAADSECRRHLREQLRRVPDIARALARISVGRSGPRDLGNISDGLKAAHKLRDMLSCPENPLGHPSGEIRQIHDDLVQGFASTSPLQDTLDRLLVIEPPYLARDGGFIKAGAHAPLDEIRNLRDESRRVIANLEARYRTDSGVAALRIKHNAILGYFIEVTPQHSDKLLTGANHEIF